jgi:hypothetical protein
MRKVFASIALVGTLALTACGGTADKVSADPTDTTNPVSAPSAAPASTPKPTPTEDKDLSSRGNLIMTPGTFGTISDQYTNTLHAKFAVNSIAPIECVPQPYSSVYPPENGALIAVDITAETTPELAKASNPHLSISSYDFKYIAENGTTFNGNLGSVATYSCIDDSQIFPSRGLGPNEKVTAKIILDVPAPHGTLVMMGNWGKGFEYTF